MFGYFKNWFGSNEEVSSLADNELTDQRQNPYFKLGISDTEIKLQYNELVFLFLMGEYNV